MIEEITQQQSKSLLLTVISSRLGEDGHTHYSFMEFDHANEWLMSSVRNWLFRWRGII